MHLRFRAPRTMTLLTMALLAAALLTMAVRTTLRSSMMHLRFGLELGAASVEEQETKTMAHKGAAAPSKRRGLEQRQRLPCPGQLPG